MTSNFRLQADIPNFSSTRLLRINSYFPTDPQNATFDENEVLAEVENLMDNNVYDDIIWQWDLNWGMSRDSDFSVTMKRSMSRIGLVLLLERYEIDYTHMHTDFKSTSHAILPQYLKIIMCKLPECFGSQSRDVNFMVCHTLTFFFKWCFLDPKLQENVIFFMFCYVHVLWC